MGAMGGNTIQVPVQFVDAADSAQKMVKAIRDSVKGANIGTELEKQLNHSANQIEKHLTQLFNRISKGQVNGADLSAMMTQVNEINRISQSVQSIWQSANIGDFNLSSSIFSSFSTLVTDIQAAITELQTLQTELDGLKNKKIKDIFPTSPDLAAKASKLRTLDRNNAPKMGQDRNIYQYQSELETYEAQKRGEYDAKQTEYLTAKAAADEAELTKQNFLRAREDRVISQRSISNYKKLETYMAANPGASQEDILKNLLGSGYNPSTGRVLSRPDAKQAVTDFFQFLYGMTAAEAAAQINNDFSKIQASIATNASKYTGLMSKTDATYTDLQAKATGGLTYTDALGVSHTIASGQFTAEQQRLESAASSLGSTRDNKSRDMTDAKAISDAATAALNELRAQLTAANARIATLESEIAGKKTDLETKGGALKSGSAADAFKPAATKVEGDANKAAAGMSGFFGQLEKNKELNNIGNSVNMLAQRFVGFNAIVNKCTQVVRTAWNDIKNLDKVMTNIAVVTNMTTDQLWAQVDSYSAVAKQYGVTTQGVYEVAQIFYQQGLKTSQVNELTAETLKMARIAGMDYAAASDGMTVALRAYNMEMSEAANVTDVYSKVASMSASSSQELIEAMSKTASGAANVGASFENTTAMIATMVEATRESATNIGSALKSIIAR